MGLCLPHSLLRGVDCNCIIGALEDHLDHLESEPTQGMNRDMTPLVQVQLNCLLYVFY